MSRTTPRVLMTTLRTTASAGLLALALTGCNTTNSLEREQPTAVPDNVASKYVIRDDELGRIAQVRTVRQAVVNDLLKIDVDLYSSDVNSRRINYKFEWMDGQGMHVDTPLSIWQTKTLLAKETVTITAIAPTPACKDFRLKMEISNQD